MPVVFSSLKLVFVDDDPANQRVGQRFLKSLGVQPVNLTILGDGTSVHTRTVVYTLTVDSHVAVPVCNTHAWKSRHSSYPHRRDDCRPK